MSDTPLVHYLTIQNIVYGTGLLCLVVHFCFILFKSRDKLAIRYSLVIYLFLLVSWLGFLRFPEIDGKDGVITLFFSEGFVSGENFKSIYGRRMETLGLKVEVNPEGADSAGRFWLSYNPFLKQFSADSVVSHFNLRIGSGKGFHLLVICSDLYSPAMNWTSGASIGKSMVISETRLNPDFWDEAENSSSPAEMSWEVAEASSTAEITVSEPVLFIRLLKVALHETGHCMGIDLHCSNEGCVMRDAGSIEEIDELGVDFCNICLHEMKKKPIR